MTDFVQVQNDLAHALLSCDALNPVNVLQWRKLRLEAEIARDALWQTIRNGRSGAGILVEMPEFRVERPNLAGPEAVLIIGFSVCEEPNTNCAPETGTQLSAEEICQLILELFHGQRLNGSLGFALQAGVNAIRPTEEWGPGVLSYKVELTTRIARTQTNRAAMPTISVTDGLATLACATSEAEIRYTLTAASAPAVEDGNFPGRSNPAAQIYTAPFAVQSGDLLRCAAYKPALLGSDVNAQLIA